MIALIQRVRQASVSVGDERIAQIGSGIVALIGIEAADDASQIAPLAEKILKYRIFADSDAKMNLSLCDRGADLLLVSQFTLAADTKSGLRPSFSSAKAPQLAKNLFAQLCLYCQQQNARFGHLATGEFGANMQVALINDGPVTFILRA